MAHGVRKMEEARFHKVSGISYFPVTSLQIERTKWQPTGSVSRLQHMIDSQDLRAPQLV